MTYMAMAAHTEKCQAEVTAGRLVPGSGTSDSDKHITMITLPSRNNGLETQSSVLLTVPISQTLSKEETL